MSLLEQTIAIAVEAHREDQDRAGQPYILHPLRVMFRLETEEERTVAVLHDVVEDHGDVWPMERLRELGFPAHLLEALNCVTKRSGETYEQFVERSASNPIARRVKLADLEDNMDVRRMSEVSEEGRARLNRYLAAYRRLRNVEVDGRET
ncbi:MAG: GTP pyrophosphokinase [Verrucomicrobiia bacterium]